MLRRSLIVLALLLLAGCDRSPVEPSPGPIVPLPPPNSTALDGAWRALYWIAEPAGKPAMDVWELGGRIDLVIAGGLVTGTMTVPDGVTQGIPLTADMAGVVRVEGTSARFSQTEDTFVSRATWWIGDDTLVLVDHDVEGTAFTVVLVRGW